MTATTDRAVSVSDVVRSAVQRSGSHFRSTPLTLGVLGVFLLVGAVTGSFLSGPPESILNHAGVSLSGLKAGEWWSIWTSLFFATNPLAYLSAALMILFLLGLAERQLGTSKAAVAFFGGQFVCVTLFLLITQLARYGDDGWLGAMTGTKLIGPYAAVVAAGLSASALLPTLWQRRLRALVVSVALLLVLYVGHAETVMGALGAVTGLAAGWWIQSDQGTLYLHHRSTGREVRNLLSLTVGIFAVGPILTTVAKSPSGPLALLRDVVVNPLPTLNQLEVNCGGTVDASCLELGRQGYSGPLGLALAVVPMVLLLICADGMRRGRRMAVRIAIGVQLAVVALSAVYLALFARIPHYPNRPHTAVLSSGFAHILPLVLVPLVLAVLLFIFRGHFRVESASVLRRRVTLVVAGSWLLLAGSYSASWLAAGGLARDGGWMGLAAELARQYLPVPIPGTYKRVFDDRNVMESFLFAWSGILFWLIVLVCVWILFLRRHHPALAGEESRHAARALVKQGGDSLSWMALWEPNKYWFNRTKDAGIAYQQHGNVALTLGGPFGDQSRRLSATEEFLEYCASHALVPCLYSCTDELWPLLRGRGFHRLPVAQETRLAIRNLEFKGKEWQNVRTALNRAAKMGVKAVWARYTHLPQHLKTQLSEVSEEWAAQKAVPEMGFTLGGLDELMDPDVLCCLAVDDHGFVYGVTSWLPVFDGGTVVSWTLDFMRRRGDAFPGVMEFLIASAVLELRVNVEMISLSGSPLAQEDREAELSAEGLKGILNLVGHALEPVYGFRSLASFKSRFKPDYRTLYLYYHDPLQLPAMGRALSQAYLPGLSVRHTARLLRKLVAQPE
ncbi:bifunctional lysylphosphatidylglycerol flippase/synthetase MprF [Arthrobacter sp. M4]|uniref:bifunctional lysylphosphatidylglycerol flippase/synthetase MprF n=1 Tax=Arthrobacter sp. M4 TaxID=218160 RepID=UPI001CDD4ECC|nr:DUF2156 domain-containing protein [Arthrobacter sp. M4]MCA4132169.1 DUF2156 domain-containing protein [Arthrobacter sp. M4]